MRKGGDETFSAPRRLRGLKYVGGETVGKAPKKSLGIRALSLPTRLCYTLVLVQSKLPPIPDAFMTTIKHVRLRRNPCSQSAYCILKPCLIGFVAEPAGGGTTRRQLTCVSNVIYRSILPCTVMLPDLNSEVAANGSSEDQCRAKGAQRLLFCSSGALVPGCTAVSGVRNRL